MSNMGFIDRYFFKLMKYCYSRVINRYIVQQIFVFTALFYLKSLLTGKQIDRNSKNVRLNSKDINILKKFLKVNKKNNQKDVLEMLKVIEKFNVGHSTRYNTISHSLSVRSEFSISLFTHNYSFLIDSGSSIFSGKLNNQEMFSFKIFGLNSFSALTNVHPLYGNSFIIDNFIIFDKVENGLKYMETKHKIMLLKHYIYLFASFFKVHCRVNLRCLNILNNRRLKHGPSFIKRVDKLVDDNIQLIRFINQIFWSYVTHIDFIEEYKFIAKMKTNAVLNAFFNKKMHNVLDSMIKTVNSLSK